MPTLVFLFFFVLYFCPAHLQRIEPPFGHDLWPTPRYLSISTNSSTAAKLRSNSQLRQATEEGIQFLKKLVGVFDDRRENRPAPCNLYGFTEWVTFAPDAAIKRQIPHDSFDGTCPMEIYMKQAVEEGDFSTSIQNNARRIVRDYVRATSKALGSIEDAPAKSGIKEWKRNFAQTGWTLQRDSQRCTVENFSAYRKKNELFVRTSMTNHQVDLNVPDFHRQYAEEWVRENLNSSLIMIQPKLIVNDEGEIERGPWEHSTTLFSRWGARSPLASHTSMQMEQNPAVNEALRLNGLRIEQADDSLVPSNVAILALPLAMTIVPGTFLGDRSTFAIFVYILFTDVVSVLPFLIKGIELIQASSLEESETVAFHLGNGTFGEIEVWSASCVGKSQFGDTGLIFVILSAISIVVGISLELLALCLMRRKKALALALENDPFIEEGLIPPEREEEY
ncbi:unnamed protein product [Agarophyton chilense]|eukprot:gb/GEZJ01004103.1/.p1 GENE.gb/GEZJ01004103.1/~~gb/GEZJ01004103.1/.p1  ORF type:complete len:450 (+),score=61.48 gb/GEZJ01004103.1/:1145-2494(+)